MISELVCCICRRVENTAQYQPNPLFILCFYPTFLGSRISLQKESVHKAQGHKHGLEGFGEYNDIGLAYNALRRQIPTPSKVVHIWDAVGAHRVGNGLDRGDHDQGQVVVGVERQS